jgi:hypothetical protein
VQKPPETFDVLIAILWILLGGYGGLMAYLMRSADANIKPTFWRAFLEFNAAVSLGTVVMLACTAMGWSTLWTGVIVSSVGWIGAKGVVAIIEALLFKRLGLTKDDVKEK